MANITTFEARKVSFLGEWLYRVHVRGTDLLFINLAGPQGTLGMLTVPLGYLGLPGALLGGALNWLAKKAETSDAPETEDPELLVHQLEGSFRLYAGEIRKATIEPPRTSFGGRGRAGRWVFSARDGRELKFEFDSAEQLQTALDLLAALLGSALEVNVEWDEANHRFEKKSRVNQS